MTNATTINIRQEGIPIPHLSSRLGLIHHQGVLH
jgi:hypothetical protein